MLIVASAALLKVHASWLAAFFRWGGDFQQFCPQQLLLPLLGDRAHFFPRQDVGHKNRVSVGVGQALAAVDELLDRQF